VYAEILVGEKHKTSRAFKCGSQFAEWNDEFSFDIAEVIHRTSTFHTHNILAELEKFSLKFPKQGMAEVELQFWSHSPPSTPSFLAQTSSRVTQKQLLAFATARDPDIRTLELSPSGQVVVELRYNPSNRSPAVSSQC
jgi:hypothetical protein